MCPYSILISAWQPLAALSSSHLLFPHFPLSPVQKPLGCMFKKCFLPIPSHRSDLYEISLLFQRGLCIMYTEINTMKECCMAIYLLFVDAFQSTNYRISSISKMHGLILIKQTKNKSVTLLLSPFVMAIVTWVIVSSLTLCCTRSRPIFHIISSVYVLILFAFPAYSVHEKAARLCLWTSRPLWC